MKKKKFIWILISLAIAVLTVWAVVAQSKSFSIEAMYESLKKCDKLWLLAAVLCMLGFIWLEGAALSVILKRFGYKRKWHQAVTYSAADIYFSAITPSATGGQPMCAFFMIKHGIPGATATVTLIANMVIHTLAAFTVGIVNIFIKPSVFLSFNPISIVFITIGFIMLAGLTMGSYFLLKKPVIMLWFGEKFISLGAKLKLVRNVEKKKEKLREAMLEYAECSRRITGHKGMMLKAYLINVIQRISQILVSSFVYMALGGTVDKIYDILAIHGFVSVGTYSVPIPGGMGVADYLMLDGFSGLMPDSMVTTLELLSRSLSFYVCIIISALIVLIGYISVKRNDRKKRKQKQ